MVQREIGLQVESDDKSNEVSDEKFRRESREESDENSDQDTDEESDKESDEDSNEESMKSPKRIKKRGKSDGFTDKWQADVNFLKKLSQGFIFRQTNIKMNQLVYCNCDLPKYEALSFVSRRFISFFSEVA